MSTGTDTTGTGPPTPAGGWSLEASGIAAGYGRMQVLWGVDLHIAAGQAVVLLGANGAGKSTFLRALMGLLPLQGGEIRCFGERMDGRATEARAEAGVAFMSEVGVFTDLSVEDNLRLGGHGLGRADLRRRLDETWERFPQLRGRRREAAGSLSGGQRKLLGVARVLVRRPRLVMMDEPSSGLSPLFVNELVDTLAGVLRDEQVTLLLAEQNVRFLRIADRVCVIEGGRSRFSGTVAEFEQTADLQQAFFGLSSER